MPNFFGKDVHLGILKGGQLGRMLLQPCMDLGIIPHIMDDDPAAPARPYCQNFTAGNSLDFDDVVNFGKELDVLTLEFENVNLDALKELTTRGVQIHPGPELVEIVQDKGLQKEFYRRHGLPTADFTLTESRDDVAALTGRFPVVQKKRVAGYDGRGVVVLDSPDELDKAFDEPSVVEDKVAIAKEISVIVARNVSGEIELFPTAEMVFNPQANMLDYLFSPADIDKKQEQTANEIARVLAEKLELVGLLAVELFIDQKGEVLINEIAPRPHNSGHHTIEANVTSQYKQHILSIFDLPLGTTAMRSPAAMVNMVGEPGHQGPAAYEGLRPFLGMPGVYVHRYGKKVTRPFRKMGHVTIVRPLVGECLEIARQIKEEVKVISCQT